MRTGLTISGVGHAAVLLWSVLTLAARPYHVDSTQALSIDVISTSEFSQLTNGAKTAPPAEHPKPVAEKVGEAAPVDDPAAKLANKEIKAATDVPPVPEPKPPEPKAKKPPQPQAATDPIAEALKKDEDKKPEPKKPDPKPPTPPKKPVQQEPAPQFDPRKVAALLDKRTPQHVASAAGEVLNNTPRLGDSGGSAGQLSQSETGALRARLEQLWNVPAGVRDPRELTLDVEIKLNPDGTLAAPPIVLTGGNSPLFIAARDSAYRAVYQGQPYTMLRPEHYELWKDIIVTFDPQRLLGN
jgi:outer membrane biosynthesis protein TonB